MALVKFDPFDIRPFWGRTFMRDLWPEAWEDADVSFNIPVAVSYTHLTLPTN